MKKLPIYAATLLASAGIAFAQDTRPSPTPAPDDVVKISTNLVQLDVTVTDRKGKPVSDLRLDEIQIFENGVRQAITNFSFISSASVVEKKPEPIATGAVPPPVQAPRADQIRRTIALVVDDLSLSFESAYHTRRALKKFVDEQVQDGDLVAIIRTGAGIGALQQFTSDKRLLYAAIERVKWNPLGTGKIGAFAPITPTPAEQLAALGDPTVDEEAIERERNQINAFNDFQGSVFATGTLGALRYVITGMSELPGRKSVIMFSEGFRLYERDEFGFQASGRVLDFLRQIVELANRSSVVFYTIDSRGLQDTGLTAADQVTSLNPASAMRAMTERRDELLDTQDGLKYLAEETGGLAIINNNDLAGGVRRALDDQSYYLVGYDPGEGTFDAIKRKFNKIDVRVLRPGLSVRYRSGFFNVADSDRPATTSAANATPAQQLKTALTSPFGVSGINLRLNALFGNEAKTGSFVRSLLHVNAGDLKFVDENDSIKKAVFEVMAISFGDNGQVIDQLARSYTLSLTPDAYKRIIAEGFVYHFMFPVKKPGAYQYRVAIRDAQAGKLGSASQFIEVPNLKRGRHIVSSIVLENLSTNDWRRMSDPNGGTVATDPMTDTALRRVSKGSVLRYGFEVYGAKLDATKRPSLTMRIRVFRDGQLILDGKETPVDVTGQIDLERIKTTGALAIGDKMQAGDHILQIIVTDRLASVKRQIATQFVQFEVVE